MFLPYLSKENKIFFPIVPEDYHLGVAGAASDSSEIRDPQVLLSDPAFQNKAANTEVILFNGFTFTTQKVQGIDAVQKALIDEAINAAKSSPDNIVIVDSMG